jgi:hypothetical protein
MEIQNIVIFALLGALCVFIITGGVVSMTAEEDPSSSVLASGAAIGGALGASMSYISSVPSVHDLYSSPDMKVGLPTF